MSTSLNILYVCYMELKERVSRVLMMLGIVYFVKAKCDLEILPPTHYALKLHIKIPTIKLRYDFKQTMQQ